MKHVTRKALIALLIPMAMLHMTMQPLFANDCADTVQPHETVQLVQLEHAKDVTVQYQAGQSAILANDATGNADLVSRSVVRIDFEPSHEAIGYGVESIPPLDITPLLYAGSNTVRMTTVDPRDTAWIRITSPCPTATPTAVVRQDNAPPITPSPAVVTASPTEDTSIASTPPFAHTENAAKTGKAHVPVMEQKAVSETGYLWLVGPLLIGLVLLALLWMLGRTVILTVVRTVMQARGYAIGRYWQRLRQYRQSHWK